MSCGNISMSLVTSETALNSADCQFMQQALRLAARGIYSADPNPRVGCVLVKEGVVVGEGWHRQAGEPHAEINALSQAGEKARGATVYVTLEPCCHYGRTPPCTNALLEAGVARVVAAMPDPDPRVSGRGFSALRNAGVHVVSGVLRDQAEELNPGFISRMSRGRPWVRCKLAMSLDGRTAMANGESKWITSRQARADVQKLRARSSAVLTGIETVIADDPLLNVRSPELGEQPRQPLRVVLDRRLRISSSARLFSAPGDVIVFCGEALRHRREDLAGTGGEIVPVPFHKGGVDLEAVMLQLAQRQINEIMLEAGATLSGAMLQAGLIDELVVYVAPHIMGDMGRGLFHLPGIEYMKERIGVDIREIRAIGRDWRITARVDKKSIQL